MSDSSGCPSPAFRKTPRWLLFALALIVLCGLSVILLCLQRLSATGNADGKWHSVQVQRGDTLRDVSLNLKANGIISDPLLFQMAGRLKGYDGRIKAGEYRLGGQMSALTILEKLKNGEIISYRITIPEGFTADQIGDLLDKKDITPKEAFMNGVRNPQTVERLGFSGNTLEGYLYPDTYRFCRNTRAIQVIRVMTRRFREMVTPLNRKIEASGMTLKEVITLASMVEKETGAAKERPIIAAVFHNRIKKNMRLESDPTVIYGIENFDGNITRKDLKTKTPYNTYVIRGLPAGPIANPGIAAIDAVLKPAGVNYYFFVSRNDGTHQFSKTLREHNRAVRIFQKNRREHQSQKP